MWSTLRSTNNLPPSDTLEVRTRDLDSNTTCVRRGHLGECTIRVGYAPFLIEIAFRRVGRA